MPDHSRTIDFYDYMKSSIHTTQIAVDECLLVNYQCWEKGSDQLWFKECHFVFILSGEKKWESNGEFVTANKGDIVFVKQGSAIVHHSDHAEFCVLILFIPYEFVTRFIINNDLPFGRNYSDQDLKQIVKLENNMALEGYRNSLLSYLADSQVDLQQLARVKLEELFHYVFTNDKLKDISAYLKSIARQDSNHLKYIMEANFMVPIGLEQYASMSNMSLSTFKRRFQEIFNMAPGIWLAIKRLEFSKRLLSTSNMTVAEIADASGFNSTSYFVKAFKQEFHLTPLQYKKGL